MVYDVIKYYFYVDDPDDHFNIIGHAYCVELLSQTKYTGILLRIMSKIMWLAIYINMITLSKEYPYLKDFGKKL